LIKIGTDIVAINRIENSLKRFGNRYKNRFLNKNEQKLSNRIESIAGYWASKEAISKALGCGIGKELSFLDIEIYKDNKNAPYFKINSDKFNIIQSSLSISHDSGFAIAVVIIIL
jgi:holo-[acyl-carrier protein] synthase